MEQNPEYTEHHKTVEEGFQNVADDSCNDFSTAVSRNLKDTANHFKHLLRLTAREGSLSRIAVRFTYFTADRDGIRDMVRSVQEEVDTGFTEPWQVNFYPDTDDVGIVEVVLREA